jgi:hypothetical protein
MLKSLFSILLLFIALEGSSQKKLLVIKDTAKLPERQVFIRFGVDLSRFALRYVGDIPSKGFEASVDGEVKYRYFPTIEAGFQSIDYKIPGLQYQMSGNYARIGFDYNITKYKHRLDRNLFYIGTRLGYTRFSHEAPEITITSAWDTVRSSMPKMELNALWFEGLIGIKGELVTNLYMSFTVRVKSMINHSNYNNYKPYIVPGFGKGFNFINTGINYSIYYAIPIKNPKLDFEK